MIANELDEEHFIPQSARQQPRFVWLCMLAVLLVAMSVWAIETWTRKQMKDSLSGKPFHAVTNRDISLFLWSFPQHMRAHQTRKAAYLPGFDYGDREGIKAGNAERLVVVPPDVLYNYHQWKRLLGSWVSRRSVSTDDLRSFIEANPEWHPKQWKKAPKEYAELIQRLDASIQVDAQAGLELPIAVQQAVIGWKNYFFEGAQINAAQFSADEVRSFLQRNTQFTRPHWRNILMTSQEDYLKGLKELSGSSLVPEEKIAPFLRVALFNERKARSRS